MNLQHIIWAAPQNLSYFVLFFGALALIAYRAWRTSILIHILGRSVSGQRFLHHISLPRIIIKNILFSLALFFIFLTLLHPSCNTKEEKVLQDGRNILIALDISRSMLAQDVGSNRLELAKKKIKNIVKSLHAERVGLMLFSDNAIMQCPLTRDTNAFFMYLDQVDTDTIANGSTSLERVIAQALSVFEEGPPIKNKLLVIVTDGEDFSHDLQSLSQKAHEQNLTLFTVGVGTAQGAPIPLYDAHGTQQGHLKDEKNMVVISRLNEPMLQNLSSQLDGIYVHASNNDDDIKTITRSIEQREKETIEEKKISHLQEQYHYFLLASFMLLALEWLL